MNGSVPLGRAARLAYALPAIALAVVGIPIYVFVPRFYTNTIGVDLAVVGGILGCARLLDAFLDPLIGVLSDRTRTRLGRRRPWMILGSIPLAVALALLLAPFQMGAAAAPLFAVSIFAVFFAWAAVMVPYESLGMELTDDYDDRTRLLGLRDGFVITGMLLSTIAPFAIGHLLHLGKGPAAERTTFQIMAAIYAPLIIVLCAGCAFFVPERALPEKPLLSPWDKATRRTLLANRPFVIVLGAYFMIACGSNLVPMLMPYYVAEYLRSDRFEIYIIVYFVIGIAVLPVWVALSRRIGKKAAWIAGTVINSGAFFFVVFLDRTDEFFYALIVVCSGLGYGATIAMPSSLQADVLDYDELLSGERREGLLLGVWCILRKFAPALPVAGALAMMKASGWVEGKADQTERAFFWLKVLYAVVPSICTAIAVVIALRYPIDRDTHARILAALDARKRGEPVVDPLQKV